MEPTSLWRAFIRERRVSKFNQLENLFRAFSITEKVFFLLFLGLLGIATLSLLGKISDSYSVTIPHHGGSLVEGVLGTPRFINPLLATSDADRDLSALVYSGLLRATSQGGFVPDLAESYTVSPDGLTYTVIIKKSAQFHDGVSVTADDVEFTVQKAQDATLKSPRRPNWEGVTVKKLDSDTVVFSLKQPYAPFLNNLTLGILPFHIWKNVGSDQIPFSSLNINAIGSGPYVISSLSKSSDGIPTELTLHSNKTYTLGEPYIKQLTFIFFPQEKSLVDALVSGTIESASNISPNGVKNLTEMSIVRAPLTRVFGIFFNQNENELLAHKEVRKALSLVTDKEHIIETVLHGFATPADGPLPATENMMVSTSTASSSLAQAQAVLIKAGWKKNPTTGIFEYKAKGKNTTSTTTLALSLSTANIPELVESAKLIEARWTELGAQVDVRVFEPADLNQSIIRPRKYDALLFGLVTGKSADLYPFWHSSQRNDPGLNVALYTNQKADKLLEKMRQSTSTEVTRKAYSDLKTEITADTPALFLWSPDFIYTIPDKLKGVKLGEITTSSDRFSEINTWYVETDRVWNIFVKDTKTIINN